MHRRPAGDLGQQRIRRGRRNEFGPDYGYRGTSKKTPGVKQLQEGSGHCKLAPITGSGNCHPLFSTTEQP